MVARFFILVLEVFVASFGVEMVRQKRLWLFIIKNARKSFPKLANNQDNIQLSIVHYKA